MRLLTNKKFIEKLNEDLKTRLIGLSDDNLAFFNTFKVGKEEEIASVLNSFTTQGWGRIVGLNPDDFQNAFYNILISAAE